MKTERFHCTITALAPLHLGTGEVYEPMGFVLDADKMALQVFDPMDFTAALEQGALKRFQDICRKGTVESVLELYRFYNGNLETGRRVAQRSVAVCKGLVDKYRQMLRPQVGNTMSGSRAVRGAVNELQIGRTAWLAYDGRPFLPGSAIKGAMRTAWLNGVVSKAGPALRPPSDNKDGSARALEQRFLGYGMGGFENDPFRMVHVSDFMPVGHAPTRIVYAVNVKKNAQDAQLGPPQLLEVVRRGVVFSGTIAVLKPEGSAAIRNPLVWNGLAEALHTFYSREKGREDHDLETVGAETVSTPSSRDAGLVRIGRHSGAECLTIEPVRRIRIKTRTGYVDKPNATTLWLAGMAPRPADRAQLLPFGWAALRVGGDDLARECEEKERLWQEAHPQRTTVSAEGNRSVPAPAVPDTRGPAPGMPSQAPETAPATDTAPSSTVSLKDILLRQLAPLRSSDAGPMGSILQRVGELESAQDRAQVALAIRDKLGGSYKKHKRRAQIDAWIGEGKK